jgi:hypothetical protein
MKRSSTTQPTYMLPGITGLWWVWTRELYVFNGTKHAIHVELGDSGPVIGLGIGTGNVLPVTIKTRMVTLTELLHGYA